jgi:two-component system, LuxR family, response regulator FixJ
MTGRTVVCVVDDDAEVCRHLKALLTAAEFAVKDYPDAGAFLADDTQSAACLVADVHMPRMDGLALLQEISRQRSDLPVVLITSRGEVDLAVQAMKAGAVDFIEKPLDEKAFLDSVRHAVKIGEKTRNRAAEAKAAQKLLARLTPRERHVLEELVSGLSNKAAAHKLGLSPRTIEVYRAQIMTKLHAGGLSDLVRLAIAARRMPHK